MSDVLARLFEHNLWANLAYVEACAALTDEQLDTLREGSTWSIRAVITHVVQSERGYLALLTLPADRRPKDAVPFEALGDVARAAGEGLLEIARDPGDRLTGTVYSTDGYAIDPWVVMVQVINHAHDHRRQIHEKLQALGVTPPNVTGWDFGEAQNAVIASA